MKKLLTQTKDAIATFFQKVSSIYFGAMAYIVQGFVWLFRQPPLKYLIIGYDRLTNPRIKEQREEARLAAGKKPKFSFTRNMTMQQRKAFTGYLFMTPWIIGFLGLVVYPFGQIIRMSISNVFLQEGTYAYEPVGFDNFHAILFEDIDFVIEAQNFVVRVMLYTPVIITLAIIISILLNQDIKGKGIFRMIFFLPIIILNGELLSNMSDYGGMDIEISFFVLDIITTIVPHYAVSLFVEMFAYIVEILWYTGVPILIFLAMLQKIDRSLYEAASIDGANAWSIFWKITLPIIRPAITVSIIFIVVFLANFDGNPINSIILTSKNDSSRREGYASAMALIYSFVQILVISVLYFIAREKPQKGRA